MAVTVTFGGVVLGNPDTAGVRWHVMLDGWDDSPPVRSNPQSVPGAWGAVDAERAYDPRAIVVSGYAQAPTETAMWTAMESLSKLADSLEADVELRVANPLRTLVAACRSAGDVKVQPQTDTAFKFQIPLVALDPRKYSPFGSSQVFGAGTADSHSLTGAGTAKRLPFFSITVVGGPLGATNFHFRNNTDDATTSLLYLHAVANGETITFDPLKQVAFSSTRGWVTGDIYPSSVWPDLLRGANAVDVWTDAGSLTATVLWRDAWI